MDATIHSIPAPAGTLVALGSSPGVPVSALQARWEPVVRADALDAGIDPDVFVALIAHESGFDPTVSGIGGFGIAQINPAYHPVDVWDPEASLTYAAGLIRSYLDEFGGRYDLALAAYNVSAGGVHRAGDRLPVNGQTEHYVARILADAIARRTGTVVSPAPTPSPTPTPDHRSVSGKHDRAAFDALVASARVDTTCTVGTPTVLPVPASPPVDDPLLWATASCALVIGLT
ncbi:MAG: lytic transglycosylase domain-containing protein [Actinobacteria bacterium]|nr:lytic transglycosylase domain-containing protein [Actinomycetota bacterium]